jgi:hypothetical protein
LKINPSLTLFSSRQQETNLNYYFTDQSSNGITTERNNDMLLKQLLKNITVPQTLNGEEFQARRIDVN